ncbi:hypothetical protein [Hyphococcus sp.]|uniref:hypothetical protein n=1 Tax=Hyphococcus sp. TaxID=2038636 RepID=UPI0035C6E26D
MLRKFLFVLLLLGSLAGIGHAETANSPADGAAGPIRILFIGNSLTYFNDLPAVLEQTANHDGVIRAETALVASGGATLAQHWKDGAAAEMIRSGDWDYVVLQEQSQLGARIENGARKMDEPEAFYSAAREFDREINNADAQTVFMLTWSHKDKPEEQALLHEAYESIACELGAVLAPAGAAWRLLRERNSGIDLYYDNVHPNFNGTYLSAMVVGMILVPGFPKSGGGVHDFIVAAEEPPATLFETYSISPVTAFRLRHAARIIVEGRP